MPATHPARPQALALGLLLPLALAGTASAQQPSAAPGAGWVDPPARTAAPDAVKPPAADRQAQGQPVTQPAKGQPDGGRAANSVRQAAKDESRRADSAKAEPAEDGLPKAAGTRAPGPKRAAALERPSGREGLHRRAHHPSRLAETPAASAAPAAPAATAHAAAARALTASYLATVSGSGDTMVGAATQFYATRVRFYGRPITTAALVAEKRSFVQRWPERRYEPRAMRAACDAETCTIRAIVDFRTANPGRGAVSSGEAELILEVGFAGTRPYILGETGRVLRRSIQAGTLAASPGKA